MPPHVLVAPEVRGLEACRPYLPYVVDALHPRFDVNLGRWRRRADVGLAWQPDTGHVTGEERPRVRLEVGEVMVGVPRRVMGDEGPACGLHLLSILQDLQP